jgi:quinol monooxygenase YgiN
MGTTPGGTSIVRERAPPSTFSGRGRWDEFVTLKGEPMIHVIAVITAKPGQREKILELFRANVPAVRAEKGCIEYGAATDAEGGGSIQTKLGPDTFMVVEKWESVEALKAHAAAPHMATYGAKTKELLAGRVIHVLSPV